MATIARPPLEPPGVRPPIPSTGYIVSIFKVFEGDDGLKFEQNWLYWTGTSFTFIRIYTSYDSVTILICKWVIKFLLWLYIYIYLLQVPVWCTDICRNRWAWDESHCTSPCHKATKCIYWSANVRNCKTIYPRQRYCCPRYVPVYAVTPVSIDLRCASDFSGNADHAPTMSQ